VLGRERQEDFEFKDSLGYTARYYLKKREHFRVKLIVVFMLFLGDFQVYTCFHKLSRII
jgi:hypothetical protein